MTILQCMQWEMLCLFHSLCFFYSRLIWAYAFQIIPCINVQNKTCLSSHNVTSNFSIISNNFVRSKQFSLIWFIAWTFLLNISYFKDVLSEFTSGLHIFIRKMCCIRLFTIDIYYVCWICLECVFLLNLI